MPMSGLKSKCGSLRARDEKGIEKREARRRREESKEEKSEEKGSFSTHLCPPASTSILFLASRFYVVEKH